MEPIPNPRHTGMRHRTHQDCKPQIYLLLEKSIDKTHTETATTLGKAELAKIRKQLFFYSHRKCFVKIRFCQKPEWIFSIFSSCCSRQFVYGTQLPPNQRVQGERSSATKARETLVFVSSASEQAGKQDITSESRKSNCRFRCCFF